MKILIPMTGFGRAGGHRVLSELATHWNAQDHQADFLVDARSEEPYFPTSAAIHRFDLQGRLVGGERRSSTRQFAASGNALSIYQGMYRALAALAGDYDVMLANQSMTAFPVALARASRAAKFYYVQAYEPEYYELASGWKPRILQGLSTLSYRLPLHQVVNAPIYVDYREIRAKRWIPPGVDERVFHARTVPPFASQSRTWTVGVIGRREPTKGTKYALEGFTALAAIDPDVWLKVAYGNLPDNWRHDRAEVIVPANDRELADFYRSVDVLVAPGTVQLGACHYPVLEAMACGTPVVTTGYLPADPSNAWIVPVMDGAAIAEALQKIRAMPADERQLRLDTAARAIAPFSWSNVATAFIGLFEDALARRH